MTPIPAEKQSNAATVWRVAREFLPYAKPYRASIAVAVFWVLLRVAAEVLQPLSIKIVIDNVLKEKPLNLGGYLPGLSRAVATMDRWTLLNATCLAALALAVLYGVFAYLSSSRISAIGQHITHDIRKALFNHVQSQSLSFFDNRRTGDILSRMNGDISNVQEMLVSVISILLVNLLLIAGILAVMARTDLRFTFIALTVTPLLYLVSRHYTAEIKNMQRKAKRKDSEIASVIQETLTSIRIVQAFAREDHEAHRFAVPSDASKAASLRATELQARFEPVLEGATVVATLAIVFVGGRRVIAGEMTLGTLVVFMTYLRILYGPIRQLGKLVNVTTKATISAERVAELLDAEPEVRDAPDAIECPRLIGRVTFEEVMFAYGRRGGGGGRGATVLSQIDLDVRPGNTVALVGSTGAGKSSLVNLIPRFYDATEGVVRLDGIDVRQLKVRSVRRQISVVPQEAVLFRAAIWENIAYGCEDFPPGFGLQWLVENRGSKAADELMERIRRAAQEAHASEFIDLLPDGYDTVLGERGATLSGGQRQRIAIARAMVRNAPILLLDEPTTGLDAQSESLVIDALERLKRGRTTFVVAHHLATIRRADLILVMEQGRIVESGTHDQLYRPGTRYKQLLDLQHGYIDPSELKTGGALAPVTKITALPRGLRTAADPSNE